MSDTTPFWVETAQLPDFPRLTKDIDVEVLVVGGGMAGISAAYLLRKAGRRVALIESGRLVERDTAHTTAHVTCVTDTRLSELVRSFGHDHARAAWEAGWAAIEQIQAAVRDDQIACEFMRVPAYLHAPRGAPPDEDQRRKFREEAELAMQMGFDAAFVAAVPVMGEPGVRFSNQAKFHPRKYLAGLLAAMARDEALIFEKTEATEFHDDPLRVVANGCSIRCEHLVIATHVPLQGPRHLLSATLFQTKLALYSTYAIRARLTSGSAAAEASFWDTAEPYHYLRIDQRDDHDYAILGGADHKTGQQTDTEQNYAALERHLHDLFPGATTTHRWSGQVIETPDGLPYIGEMARGQFIATGFAGNGMTFGTLAGIMARDAVLGVKNPWTELFDPHRKKLRAVVDYLRENKDYPFYLVRDRLRRAEQGGVTELKPGEGKIVRQNGTKSCRLSR